MKKTMAILLALIMLLPAVPAFATDVRTSGDFQYTIKGNGTATIVGYAGTGDIIIPQMLDGYTVSGIGDNAFYREEISKNTISVTVPETVKTIGDFAFWNINVASINIPDAVEYIGKGAFVGCNECNFRISNNHPKYAVIEDALYDKSKKELIKGREDTKVPEGIVSIGDYAYYGAGNMYWLGAGSDSFDERKPSYLFPSTVTQIGDFALAYNDINIGCVDRNPKYCFIMIAENLIEIGNGAFQGSTFAGYDDGCTIIFPDCLESIGEECFYDCHSVNSNGVYFSSESQLRVIPKGAFKDCSHFRIIIDAPIEEVEEEAFYRSMAWIDLSNIQAIGEYAFYKSDLYNFPMTIPGTCETVSKYAFAECTYYSKTRYPEPYNRGCSRQLTTDITIEDGVECIEEGAFSMAEGKIGKVYLPSSLSDIALDAFPEYTEFVVESGSYAERWLDENALIGSVSGEEQNLDWLNS